MIAHASVREAEVGVVMDRRSVERVTEWKPRGVWLSQTSGWGLSHSGAW